MAEAILKALDSDKLDEQLESISRLESVPEDKLEQIFRKIADNFNHEVRESAASKITLCPKMYQTFLSDPDPKVRVEIVKNSVEIRRALNDDENILKSLQDLTKDSVAEVRVALGHVIYKHSKVKLGDEGKTITLSKIVPLIDTLLGDRSDDVRVAASQNIKELTILFGFDFVFEQLYTSLHHMLTDTQWRVRNNAIEILFGLALACNADFFNENLFPFLIQFLRDPCNKVRAFAVEGLPALVKHFGEEWLKTKLIVSLKELADSPNFLYRETYLQSISVLANFFPVQYQSNYVFQPMIRMLRDPVHNVVLLAIELLSEHRESIHPFRRQHELKPILESLVENSPQTIKERSNAFLAECQ